MTKEQRSILMEYIANLPDEDVRFLAGRLCERLCGDLAEALDFMGQHQRMDSVLASAVSAEELFTVCDQVREVVIRECKRRGISVRHFAA